MAASPYCCFFVSLCPSFQYGIDVGLLSKLQNLPENKWVEIAPRDGSAVGVSDNLRDLAPRIIAHRIAISLPDFSMHDRTQKLQLICLFNHPHIGQFNPFDYASKMIDVSYSQKVYTKTKAILPKEFAQCVKITGFGSFQTQR
jgi:hypothetical protein